MSVVVVRLIMVLAALLVASCSDGERDRACHEACARPFDLLEAQGERKAKAWEQIPEELRGGLGDVMKSWREALAAARDEYVEACLPGCLEQGTSATLNCRRRAGNVGEWKRCTSKK